MATVVALAVLLLTAAGSTSTLIQDTGVFVVVPIGSLGPGHEACQAPIVPLEQTAAVSVRPLSNGQPTPPFVLTVRELRTRRPLARGRLAAGWPSGVTLPVPLNRPVPAGRPVALCVRDVGKTPILLMGDDGVFNLCLAFGPQSLACRFHLPHPVNSASRAFLDGHPVGGTMYFGLLRAHPRSPLDHVGDAMRRASNFRPGFVSEPVWWVLLIGVLLGTPALLLLALRTAAGEAEDRPAG